LLLKIIKPNSSDPIAAPRSAPPTGRIMGRLVALLAVAALLIGLVWLRQIMT
jgi:hypothetical protein